MLQTLLLDIENRTNVMIVIRWENKADFATLKRIHFRNMSSLKKKIKFYLKKSCKIIIKKRKLCIVVVIFVKNSTLPFLNVPKIKSLKLKTH